MPLQKKFCARRESIRRGARDKVKFLALPKGQKPLKEVSYRAATALRPFRFRWGRGGGFGCGHERGECGGVFHRDVREDFAVEGDTGGFQAVDQLAVGQAVVACGGADALDPELAILALLDAAVALGVAIGAIGGFLGGLVELALCQEKAFCSPEVLFAPCTALGAAFYSSHGVSPSSFAGAEECGVEEFVRTGLKARRYKTSALRKQRPRILMGNKTGC